jgi:phosphatidate cytidylyltransferase
LTASLSFKRDLAARVLTAFFALPVLVGTLLWAPPLAGVGMVGLLVLRGIWGFGGLARARGVQPYDWTGLALTAAIFLEVAGWPVPSLHVWPLVTVFVLIAALSRAGDIERVVPAVAATVLGAVYLGALGGAMAGLLLIEPQAQGGWRGLLLMTILMTSDTFAYFTGHAFGRRRLAPTISPGKTVEGALGGLVGGVVAALGIRVLGLPDMPLVHAVLLGLVVAAAGIAGDLFESLLKRWAGVKDSGRLFPGHGGMLDRLDSLLFGAPVLYCYYYFLR